MAKPKRPSLLQRYPWLLILSVSLTLFWAIFAFIEYSSYKAQSIVHRVSLSDVAATQPTSGTYEVKGGVLNYVYAEAVGFENDHDKDAGHDYDSFVPYIDPVTKKVIMLVEMPGYSPADFTRLIDQGQTTTVSGAFYSPSQIDPKLWPMFDARHYPIDPTTPVLLMYGGADPAALKSKLILTALVAVLVGGGSWALMAWISRPKKPYKKFSERYPERRTY